MKKVFVLIAALVMSATIASAEKIGIVDGPRASQSYWKLQSETKSLSEEQGRLQDLQQQIRGSIEQLGKEIEAAKQDAANPGLSAERRAAAQKDVDDKTQQIQQYQSSFQMQVQRFQRRQQDMQVEIENDVLVSVKKVAKAQDLDAVFLSQACPYAKIDITDLVVEDLNSTQPKENTPAPAAAPSAPAAAAPAPAVAPAPAAK
jgi:Skp family chaperone for outer membrane proteins